MLLCRVVVVLSHAIYFRVIGENVRFHHDSLLGEYGLLSRTEGGGLELLYVHRQLLEIYYVQVVAGHQVQYGVFPFRSDRQRFCLLEKHGRFAVIIVEKVKRAQKQTRSCSLRSGQLLDVLDRLKVVQGSLLFQMRYHEFLLLSWLR